MKTKVERLILTGSRNCYKIAVIRHQDRQIDQWNTRESPKLELYIEYTHSIGF